MRFAAAGGDAAEAAEHADELEHLMSEVERLPGPLREALMLYYYEDCTYQDLAQRLGVSAATVNARLTQARMALRDKLIPREKRRVNA
jgi:RNA polymerase sigma-70 factor (ECF subfamily)